MFGRGEKNTHCTGTTNAKGDGDVYARLHNTGLYKPEMVLEPIQERGYSIEPPDLSGWHLDP